MAAWDRTLAGVRDFIWDELERAAREAGAAARHVALATAGVDGPEVRTLALRRADRHGWALDLHTDLATPKVAELRADPRASVLAWLAEEEVQLRLKGRIHVASGAAVGETWDRVPDASRGNYGVTPPPGTAIDGPEAYRRVPDPGRFAVLTMTVDALDAVMLAPAVHRRARFARADGWRGAWLSP